MAHLVEQMAYVGDTPWHGLGEHLPNGQPIEVWQKSAGMDWSIEETPVRYLADQKGNLGTIMSFEDQKVLYRSDTKAALSVVSQRYQVVQPRAVLNFYRGLTEFNDFELETAGVLKGGRKFWALARTGQSLTLKGGDVVNGYLLLATSCDGSMATTATPTTVRVVCNNTLTVALERAPQTIRVPHNTQFDEVAVKRQLGLSVSQWDEFMIRLRTLSERKVKSHEAMNYFLHVLCDANEHTQVSQGLSNERALKKVLALYEGEGRGAELDSAKGTAWGLVNAVTEYVDHERRARSTDNRLDSAWFGVGAQIKQKALDQALLMVA
jgi:phage/plasmid-like protein (TIGR03299 family)